MRWDAEECDSTKAIQIDAEKELIAIAKACDKATGGDLCGDGRRR